MEIDGPVFSAWRAEGRPLALLDIREKPEVDGGHAAGAILLPMNQVPDRLDALPRDVALVVYCAAGARSYGVAHYLRDQGFADAWSLAGGFGELLAHGTEERRPPRGVPFGLLTPVRLTAEAARARGLNAPDKGLPATIQEVAETPDGLRYAVRITTSQGAARIDGLSEAELEPIGRTPRRR
ncbi:MAG: rhodanese-like domain-containing protein [Alphaproteobacteria bacterium]|nr:rhodanese-like domain-containing protein [Alphaproteobacteria bacterium]